MASERLEELKKMMEEEPDDPFLRYALAIELFALSKNENAFAELTFLLKNFPDYLPAYYKAAELAQMLNQTDQSKQIILKGMQLARKKNDRHTLSELNALLDNLDD